MNPKFAAAASSYAAVVSHHSENQGEKIVAFAQVLGAAVCLNGKNWTDQEKAQFLAAIVDTALHSMPELEFEFGVALKSLQEQSDG